LRKQIVVSQSVKHIADRIYQESHPHCYKAYFDYLRE
jgi:hypothetical protein